MPKQNVPISKSDEFTRCPLCGMAVRISRDPQGNATHYDRLIDLDYSDKLEPVDPETSAKLKKKRAGKKTVALVGMSLTSSSLAPFDDKSVEIWGLNECHAFKWMKRWDRWFQMHQSKSVRKPMSKRKVYGHFDWLKDYHNKPIYMQFVYDEVPDSTEYPLRQVVDQFFDTDMIVRGEQKIKYFRSTFDYMMALALYECFDRIEIYGFDMAGSDEYTRQKPSAEFWIGVARGAGVEIYLPPENQLLVGKLYGYEESYIPPQEDNVI